MIQFTIPGNPAGKARARVTRYSTYTPDKTVNYEVLVKEIFAINYPRHTLLEKALWMTVDAYFDVPKSYTKGKKLAAKHNMIRPTKKPDADNILKIIADSLNGIAYKDDSQIVNARVRKLFDEGKPRIEVTLEEVPND